VLSKERNISLRWSELLVSWFYKHFVPPISGTENRITVWYENFRNGTLVSSELS